MSHRAHYALISGNEVLFHSDKWGAMELAVVLVLGPERFKKWFDREVTNWPEAANEHMLGVIPEDFAVINFDQKQLKFSNRAGLAHQAEQALSTFPEFPDLADHLDRLTPQVRHAFLKVMSDIWFDWKVTFADSPKPQFDWKHLQDAAADEVWKAFKVLSPPVVQGKAKSFLVPEVAIMLKRQAQAYEF